jgi:mannonate dehydratase
MKLGLDARGGITDELLSFGAQLGATDVIGGGLPQDAGYWEYLDLLRLRTRVEAAGMRLYAIENLPQQWMEKIKLGLPGRDEQLGNVIKTLRNMGAAGIPVLGYNFMPVQSRTGYAWRTSGDTIGRGGARVTSFDYELVRDAPLTQYGEVRDDEMWSNYEYFLKAVVPAAEQAGVKIGVHPDDPPISPLAGLPRILRSHDALQRLCDTVPSDHNGLEFCQGTVSEMPENVIDAIRRFGGQGKIFYVHFRNVSGTVPKFQETFIDEGYVDMRQAMRAYHEIGFDGPFIPDHVPWISVDPRTSPKYAAEAYAMGYIKALIDEVTGGG